MAKNKLKSKKYDTVFHWPIVMSLFGKEESTKLRALREKFEATSKRYNEICNKEDELRDKYIELWKSGKKDEELSWLLRMIDVLMDEEAEVKPVLDKLEREYNLLYHKEIWSAVAVTSSK